MQNNVTERFNPSYEKGLSDEQVLQRQNENAVNEITETASPTIKSIIYKNIFTYFNLIFAIFAFVLIAVGAYRGLTFMPIIIANTLIGIIQQIRSKRVLDRLNMLHAPRARLMRNGRLIDTHTKNAVLDDIALFSGGDQIYADAVVVCGEVQVNEALLTGEADEIKKMPGDRLMSGSYVVSGKCHARLDAVGDDSYIARLTAQAKSTNKKSKSKLMSSLELLIKIAGFVILPIGIIMLCQQYFIEHLALADCVLSVIAALLGMIPEGLYLLATVALALSVIRLSRANVLVHDMTCVEALARVDVLCVDKTGTITENSMEVIRLEPLNEHTAKEAQRILCGFTAAMETDNSTMAALKRRFTEKVYYSISNVIPFSPVCKYCAAVLDDTPYILGAPDLVLRGAYGIYRKKIEQYAKDGYRVLLLCSAPFPADGKPLKHEAEPIALILLRNPIRHNAPETFKYFAEQGINIKVISGDNPVTVSRIAADAGIIGAEKSVDMSQIEISEIDKIAENTVVFGRVTPDKKRELVRALQRLGHTVAMTGDGVNDVLALKEADCSVAMASGSDAAQNVSQMVLLDSDFSGMPNILLEGRRVINNIERSAGLFLRKNIYSLLIAIFAMIAVFRYPLNPQQATLINAFTIGAPAFLLAFEHDGSRIKGNFLANAIIGALPAAIANAITLGAMMSYCDKTGIDSAALTTMATIVLGISGTAVLLSISRPLNRFRASVAVAMAAGFTLGAVLGRKYFNMQVLSGTNLLAVIIFSAIVIILFSLLTKLANTIKSRRKS